MAGALREVVASDALPAGGTVLDLGCGLRPYEPLFAGKYERYVGADLPGNPRADLDITPDGRVPLDDGAADLVLSNQVLEHVAEPADHLAEARRLLAADGRLLLSTHGLWVHHPDPVDYWRWTADGLRRQLDSAGFDIVRLVGVMGLAACAVQLWQDATAFRVPRPLRWAYVAALQLGVGFLGRRPVREGADAAVHLVVARPRTAGERAP